MNKFIKIIFLTLIVSADAISFRYELGKCETDNEQISLSYTMCVNSNFRSLSRKYKVAVKSCDNPFRDFKDSYEKCVNSNFKKLSNKFKRRNFVRYCSNLGNDLSDHFVDCVNSNFKSLSQSL